MEIRYRSFDPPITNVAKTPRLNMEEREIAKKGKDRAMFIFGHTPAGDRLDEFKDRDQRWEAWFVIIERLTGIDKARLRDWWKLYW